MVGCVSLSMQLKNADDLKCINSISHGVSSPQGLHSSLSMQARHRSGISILPERDTNLQLGVVISETAAYRCRHFRSTPQFCNLWPLSNDPPVHVSPSAPERLYISPPYSTLSFCERELASVSATLAAPSRDGNGEVSRTVFPFRITTLDLGARVVPGACENSASLFPQCSASIGAISALRPNAPTIDGISTFPLW